MGVSKNGIIFVKVAVSRDVCLWECPFKRALTVKYSTVHSDQSLPHFSLVVSMHSVVMSHLQTIGFTSRFINTL